MSDVRYLVVLLPAVVAPFVLAFGALDFSRLASRATPILCVGLALYLVIGASDAQRSLVLVAVLACLAGWRVFGVVTPTRVGYVAYFDGAACAAHPSAILLVVIGVVVMLLDLHRHAEA